MSAIRIAPSILSADFARLGDEVAMLERRLAAQGIDAPALRWYIDYCCRDDYGAGAAQVSAWAGLHYFASRHGFHHARRAVATNPTTAAQLHGARAMGSMAT